MPLVALLEQEMQEADDLSRRDRVPQEAIGDGCGRREEAAGEARKREAEELVQSKVDACVSAFPLFSLCNVLLSLCIESMFHGLYETVLTLCDLGKLISLLEM